MFKVSIANERIYEENYETMEYDLFTQKDLTEINDFVSSLEEDNYVITDIQTDNDWADYDCYTLVDDLCETALLLQEMNKFQYNLFVQIAKRNEHEPVDIARNIIINGVTLAKEIDDDDDIWEKVSYKNKVYAVLH